MPDMEPFQNALDDKTVQGDCPFCHQNTWATAKGLTRVFIAPEDPGTGNGPPEMRGFEAFTIACNNCGFLRMHAAETLMRD